MPAMIAIAAMAGADGMWAFIPGHFKNPLQHQRNFSVVDADLCGGVVYRLDLSAGRGAIQMSFGFPLSQMYGDAALIHPCRAAGHSAHIGGLHWGVVAALVLAVAAYFVMSKTVFGFQVKVMGDAPRAGRFSGFNPARTTLGVLCLSGAVPGLPAW